jgi:hypothetical protein
MTWSLTAQLTGEGNNLWPFLTVRLAAPTLTEFFRFRALLALPWSAFDGIWIRLRRSKTGRKVNVPVTRCLQAMLNNMPRTSPVVLTNSRGRPWQTSAVRKAWGAASRNAGN